MANVHISHRVLFSFSLTECKMKWQREVRKFGAILGKIRRFLLPWLRLDKCPNQVTGDIEEYGSVTMNNGNGIFVTFSLITMRESCTSVQLGCISVYISYRGTLLFRSLAISSLSTFHFDSL